MQKDNLTKANIQLKLMLYYDEEHIKFEPVCVAVSSPSGALFLAVGRTWAPRILEYRN